MSSKPGSNSITRGDARDGTGNHNHHANERTVLGVHHSIVSAVIPRGACDCHVHIFGPFDKYPLAADRVFTPGRSSTEDLLRLHAALGIDRTVVVQASPQGTDNRCMTDALHTLNAKGHTARGVAVLAPEITEDELLALHNAGVRGARINLQSYGLKNPEHARQALERTAQRVQSLGWHVQIYTTLPVIAAMAGALASCSVPVVIDHFSLASAVLGPNQPGFAQLLEIVAAGNVYIKLSAPYRLTVWEDGRSPSKARDIARALIDTRLDRMLWGTDWPHSGAWPGKPRMIETSEPLHPIDDGVQLAAFCDWVSEEEKQAIMVDNPARLYGFS